VTRWEIWLPSGEHASFVWGLLQQVSVAEPEGSRAER